MFCHKCYTIPNLNLYANPVLILTQFHILILTHSQTLTLTKTLNQTPNWPKPRGRGETDIENPPKCNAYLLSCLKCWPHDLIVLLKQMQNGSLYLKTYIRVAASSRIFISILCVYSIEYVKNFAFWWYSSQVIMFCILSICFAVSMWFCLEKGPSWEWLKEHNPCIFWVPKYQQISIWLWMLMPQMLFNIWSKKWSNCKQRTKNWLTS